MGTFLVVDFRVSIRAVPEHIFFGASILSQIEIFASEVKGLEVKTFLLTGIGFLNCKFMLKANSPEAILLLKEYSASSINTGVLGFWGFGEIGRAHV